ncbi:MAG: cell division ATP-binding protein FtsE [Leptolyngbya sp. SIO4C1]|nr:cell division ATP-binding protein FtsE [Leptolyngbya sp. SIO4C1]
MTSVATPPRDRALPKDVQARLQSRFAAAAAQPAQTSESASASAMVQLSSVSKDYRNGAQALKNVNLQINRGDFLFVTGPSGAGKSTLLKLLYGQERPTAGEIVVNNQPLSKLRGNKLALLRRRIGVVFQDYKLIPRRTVSENVAFVLWAQGYTRKEIHRRLMPTLKMVGLQSKADCFPEQLSGGEQQRVSIARAVVGTPPLLLADEPTGNLDADNSWQVIKILQKLNSIGITVVITTHDEHIVRATEHPVVQIRNSSLRYVR